MRSRVVVVGSGFAGSILARILSLQGHAVTLVESGAHPRFAVGESSTPLAAISLERMARDWDLQDLGSLATYGRWSRELPALGRGLKRGFTFYGHLRGKPYRNDLHDSHRLLVAASPSDEVADSHWRRAEVDAHLARLATEAGVELLERTAVRDVVELDRGFQVEVRLPGGAVGRLEARHLVDASGRSGALVSHLTRKPLRESLETSFVGSHYEGVESFVAAAEEDGATLVEGPFPEEKAAIHHILGDAWLYVLPFDDGTSSVGLVERGTGERRQPAASADDLLGVLDEYPTLRRSLASLRRVGPPVQASPLAYRRAVAAGERWAALPHAYAFFDPLFSTGIAWSLVAVERLALWGRQLVEEGEQAAAASLARYGRLVRHEADHIGALISLAWRAMADFDALVRTCLLYFAAASYCEARQRLCEVPEDLGAWCWDGFLGATDAEIRSWPERAKEATDVVELLAPRNVAGIGRAEFGRRIPVSLQALLESGAILGLTPDQLRRRSGRLRGSG